MLQIVPCSLSEANNFIREHHRHHKPITAGYRFTVGVAKDNQLVGVAIVGNPLSQYLQDGHTAEVRRTCTDGTRNANSKLYAACWRAAKAMGFKRLITYTMQEESGASLRAVGWTNEGLHGGGDWNVDSRHRQPSLFVEKKWRWSVTA